MARLLLVACMVTPSAAVVMETFLKGQPDHGRPNSIDPGGVAEAEFNPEDLQPPPGMFMKCLADDAHIKDRSLRFTSCLDRSQMQCKSGTVEPIRAWGAGFGSAMHTWVHSLVFSLERGLTWEPTGPWQYADHERCPSANSALECYFEPVVKCNGEQGHRHEAVNAQFYGRHNKTSLILDAARLLNVEPEWVWGHLAAFMMRMQPDVKQMVEDRIPSDLQRGFSAAFQIRIQTNATGLDNMRENLGVEPYIKYLEQLTSGSKKPTHIYVMSDNPELTEDSLNTQFPQFRFLRPKRIAVDLTVKQKKHAVQRKEDVMYDLLADIYAGVQSDIFIGTASNLFWLVYALKQTSKRPGTSCWINTVHSKHYQQLLCPGDSMFYQYSPMGLRPAFDDEYLSRRRAGDKKEEATKTALKLYVERNQGGPHGRHRRKDNHHI